MAAALPLTALFLMERRTRTLRRLFSLRAPRRRDVLTVAAVLSVLPLLLATAAAQPVIVHRQWVNQRSNAQILVVLDTSQSMSARRGPHAPTRLQRAERLVEQLLPRVGDIPVGLATMTDRVLLTLMPTSDDALIRRTINQSIGINKPPPSHTYPGKATNLTALYPLPSYHIFSSAASTHSILVVLTDGESPPLPPGSLGYDEAHQLTIPPLFVHIWGPTEHIYHRGHIDPRYQADPASGAVLRRFAELTHGRVFGEHDLGALVDTIQRRAGPERLDTTLIGYERIPLGQWLLLAGVFPLGFLFWKRNL